MKPTDADSQCVQTELELRLSLIELCQACGVSQAHVSAWVLEGALEPEGSSPAEWVFGSTSLRRARLACWLGRDLEINEPGIALVLDLFDQISMLRARLQSIEAAD